MKCEYMHKTCESGCDNHTCRAFFPLRQPLIDPKSKDVCLSDDHADQCLIYVEGKQWREEKRLQGLTEKCPFATNNRCGRPWEWRCDAVYPFLLTPFEAKEGKDDIPVRDKDGNIKFLPVDYDIKETCLSGDPSIYTTCPLYQKGVKAREPVESLKSKENSK